MIDSGEAKRMSAGVRVIYAPKSGFDPEACHFGQQAVESSRDGEAIGRLVARGNVGTLPSNDLRP